jgi:hypothetical protein
MAIKADILWQGTDGIGHPVKLDPVFGYPTTISIEHTKIHEGKRFKSCHIDADLDANESMVISITTSNVPPHLHIDIEASEGIRSVLAEDVTVGAGSLGTALTQYNLNRLSSTVPKTTTRHTPAITNSGTILCERLFGGGKKAGASFIGTEELVLKLDTVYTFSIVSTVANNVVSLEFDWYEG